jgi:hypothetical protein
MLHKFMVRFHFYRVCGFGRMRAFITVALT